MRTSLMFFFVLQIFLIGCSTTSSAIRTGPHAFDPTAPEQVQVYFSRSQVPGQFQEIGRVSAQKRAQTAGTDVNEEKVIEILKKEAASIGAHAIIVESLEESENRVSSGSLAWNQTGGLGMGGTNSFNKKSAYALAIRFNQE